MKKLFLLFIALITAGIAICQENPNDSTRNAHWSDEIPYPANTFLNHVTDIGIAYRDTVFCYLKTKIDDKGIYPERHIILPTDTTIKLLPEQPVSLFAVFDAYASMKSFDKETRKANIDNIKKMHFETKFFDAYGNICNHDSIDNRLQDDIETLLFEAKRTIDLKIPLPYSNGGNYYWISKNNVDKQVKNGHIRIEKPASITISAPKNRIYDTLLVTSSVGCAFPYDINMKGASVDFTLIDALGRKLAEKTVNIASTTDTLMEYVQNDTIFHRLKATSPYYYVISKPSWKTTSDTAEISMTITDKSYSYTGPGFSYAKSIYSLGVVDDKTDTTYHFNRDTVQLASHQSIGYNYTFRMMRDGDKDIDKLNLDTISNIKAGYTAQDIYGNILISDDYSSNIMDMVKIARIVTVGGGSSLHHSGVLNRGGNYVFNFNSSVCKPQSDTITFLCQPRLDVNACDENKEPAALTIGKKGYFRATVGSGFPFNPAEYQGKTVNFELLNGSKQQIATKSIILNVSNDSTLMEYCVDKLIFEQDIEDNRYYVVVSNGLKQDTIAFDAISDPSAIEQTVISPALPEDEKTYNLNGQPISSDYKGIIIRKNKKYLVR